jgi:RNA polymerase sigma-70 factor (ECF subfamily)
MVVGPEAGLDAIERLGDTLDGYQPYHSARADLLRRTGNPDQAASAYRRALALTDNERESRFLQRRLAELRPISD